jgi:hypothetical protein
MHERIDFECPGDEAIENGRAGLPQFPNVDNLMRMTHVVFSGSRDEWEDITKHHWGKVQRIFRPRWPHMLAFLDALGKLHPDYREKYELVEELPPDLTNWIDALRYTTVVLPPVDDSLTANIATHQPHTVEAVDVDESQQPSPLDPHPSAEMDVHLMTDGRLTGNQQVTVGVV